MVIRFSIVIPAYNYGAVVERAVRSACEQAGDDFEVIVIDDGSTDDTPQVLDRITQDFLTLKVIHQDNAGLAAVRNRGVKEARGDYLIFLDADDAFEANALAVFRAGAESHPDAGLLIAPTVSVFDDGRMVSGGSVHVAEVPQQRFLDYLYKRLSISNGAVAMHRRVFGLVSYNPALRQTEDIPVFAQCLANFEAVGLSEPTTRIYKHAGSMRHNADTALAVGLSLVDEVFNPERLPSEFQQYRAHYRARRALSVFRICKRAERYPEACDYFKLAWQADWKACLRKPEYLLKYLSCKIKA
ncbi:glycosyltransferase involved in cell wall biosynthesis [Litorivivens lipolytica]|uniref:Glycosyltransferase involved in cell wall biosynthesis n=1 Tax=Litorivivens lipolytica TaxID=1524264 RepID=A0A7W4Z6U2_9GAMM|nr:glycosyltransferase involved in cell wall biosynthesis [Litorivivens lipolytica]